MMQTRPFLTIYHNLIKSIAHESQIQEHIVLPSSTCCIFFNSLSVVITTPFFNKKIVKPYFICMCQHVSLNKIGTLIEYKYMKNPKRKKITKEKAL
jgi:hypothetical protein